MVTTDVSPRGAAYRQLDAWLQAFGTGEDVQLLRVDDLYGDGRC